ncbi:TonB family protein [Aurantiacibacter sp. MUD11]|uniref:energy transducer TonB n=1 Tax=Aurantiacibacter sp. MUD11 TaxID=3003265 RepID=UPI0022AA1144|nr:energy transducer TonB [Aurantiacibacter sp. MUD11]WAT18798.1 TonB family protein [Aurantiacibacter sp. MUD11]
MTRHRAQSQRRGAKAMSYANATVSPAARVRAVAGVIAIHAAIGAGVVAGLTITGVIETKDREFIAEFYPDPPPPPPPVEDVVEPAPVPYTPPQAPRPPIEIERDSPVQVETVRDDVPDVVIRIPTPPIEVPDTGPTLPAYSPVGPIPRNGPTGWITNADYPRRGITRELEGSATYRLVIGSNGRVSECEITRSSGHGVLDDATCNLIQRRARFDAAKNNRGENVVGTYSGNVTWQLPRR